MSVQPYTADPDPYQLRGVHLYSSYMYPLKILNNETRAGNSNLYLIYLLSNYVDAKDKVKLPPDVFYFSVLKNVFIRKNKCNLRGKERVSLCYVKRNTVSVPKAIHVFMTS